MDFMIGEGIGPENGKELTFLKNVGTNFGTETISTGIGLVTTNYVWVIIEFGVISNRTIWTILIMQN